MIEVNAVIASEHPVDGEVLLMAGLDRTRIEAGPIPVLLDHLDGVRNVIGQAKNIAVDGDKLRATLEIVDTQLEAKLSSGLQPPVSIGYEPLRIAAGRDGTTQVNLWELKEVSLVSTGADPMAGVGRKELDMKTRQAPAQQGNGNQQPPAQQQPAQQVPPFHPQYQPLPAAVQADGMAQRDAERHRVRSLLDIATRFGGDPKEAIIAGDSPEQFAASLQGKTRKPDDSVGGGPAVVKRVGDDAGQFSFRSLLNGLLNGERNAEVERCTTPAGKDSDGGRRGQVHIPGECLRIMYGATERRQRAARAPYAKTGADELAELIGTEHLASEFIPPLRPNLWMAEAGVRVLDDLMGDIKIPRQKGVSVASWVDETTALAADTNFDVDDLTATPKELGVVSEYSRKLLIQSSPSIDDLLVSDHQQVMERATELAVLQGTGANNQPTGIVNATGLTASTASAGKTNGTAMTRALVLGMVSAVLEAHAGFGRFIMSPGLWARLKQIELAEDYPKYLLDNGTMEEQPVSVTSLIAPAAKGSATKTSPLIYGNFGEVVLCRWSGLDVQVDMTSKMEQRLVRVATWSDIDVLIRLPAALTICPDAKHLA